MKFLSIDIGTSSVKAALFDNAGTEIATSLQEYDIKRHSDGRAEINPEVYWEKTCMAVREIMLPAGKPSEIAAAGITSQGETLITLDSGGHPTGNAIVWLDNRAKEEAKEIEIHFVIDRIYSITGQSEISAGYTASIIYWIKKYDPERFKKTDRFLLVTDYIVYKMTGCYFSNKALYPSTLYYDFRKESWWREMLDFLGVKEKQLPTLLDSGISAGEVSCKETGLGKGTKICPAPIDQVSGTLGAGNRLPGCITESTGTVLALCSVTEKPVFDSKKRFCIFPHAVKKKFVAMPWAPASGSILSWFKKEFCSGLTYRNLDDIAGEVGPGSEGLKVLPYFAGINCPEKIPDMRGAFWGISLNHGKEHFTRAIMEAVAYLLKDYLMLLEENGIRTEKIISLGGASRSVVWTQIKADVTCKTVETNRSVETVCLGASMVAAVGAGLFRTCEEASSAMSGTDRRFHPSEEKNIVYEKLYKDYSLLSSTAKDLHFRIKTI